MATATSVVEIDVKDEAFQRFQAVFERYQAQVSKMPGDWAKVGAAQSKAAKAGADGFQNEALAIASMTSALSQVVKNQNEVQRQSRNTNSLFKEIRATTGDILSNITKTGFQLAKWALFGGVAGLATGAFGVGALARGAADLRSGARGLRISSGQLQAGRVNYGNYLDYEGLVGNIGAAQLDPAKAAILRGAGISESDLKNKSPGDLVPQVLAGLLRRYQDGGASTPAFTGMGLGAFTDERTLQSLMRLPSGELARAGQRYGADSARLNIGDGTLGGWQQLQQQLSRAGDQIEKTFIEGLAPLAPNIEKLSASIVSAIEDFTKNPHMGEWIEDFGHGIEWVAKYLSSGELKSDLMSFGNTIHKIAHPLDALADADPLQPLSMFWSDIASGDPGGAYKSLLHITDIQGAPNHIANAANAVGNSDFSYVLRGNTISDLMRRNRHNPGNLRTWGGRTTSGGFATFDDDAQGLRAMAAQLQLYQNRDGLSTISDIVSKYAPPSENDTLSYVQDVVSKTNFGAGQKLDLNNTDQLAKLMAAMTKHENGRSNYTPAIISKVIVSNAPGADLNVQSSQLAQ